MLTPHLNDNGYTGYILIEPNRPLNWPQNLRFLRIFALISITIAMALAIKGLYLILPFSGLEILALTLALYFVYRRYSFCQIIYFTEQSIIIESGENHPTERIEYQRFWSRFHIDNQGEFNIPRLSIRCMGKSTEIGSFLNLYDKQELIRLIKNITLHFQQHHITEKL